MNIHAILLVLITFFAAVVEVVEMATIILGVGMTRGWPSTVLGTWGGIAALAGVLFFVGPALGDISIRELRATIGILLLLFGVQWLRKGILRIAVHGFRPRASGKKAETFETHGRRHFTDWTAFVLSFKGVLLEGAEVVFIILTFGVATHHLDLAILGASAAFVVVAAGAALAYPALQKIPRHVVKYAVGLLLVSYGTFWGASGLGARWPGDDLAVVPLLAFYFASSLVFLHRLRRPSQCKQRASEPDGSQRAASPSYLKSFALFWYRFIIGDDWVGATFIVAGFAGTFFLAEKHITSYWLLPFALLLSVGFSLHRTVHRKS